MPRSLLEKMLARTNRWFGAVKVSDLDAFYHAFEIWTADPAWTGAYLADDRVRKAVAALFPDGDLPPNIGLRLWPGRWTFSQHTALGRITPEAVKAWVEALTTLASVAEMAPPETEVKLNRFETLSVENPTAAAFLVATLLLGVPIFLLCCGGVVVLLLLLLLTRS